MISKRTLQRCLIFTACLIMVWGIVSAVADAQKAGFIINLQSKSYVFGFLHLCAFIAFICFVSSAGYHYLLKIGHRPGGLMMLHIVITILTAFLSAAVAFALCQHPNSVSNLQTYFLISFGFLIAIQGVYVVNLLKAVQR